MYLKRLEIQGFKSFAKKTILEFGPGITAIVGPNGSGKSNAADCLRWVLGEQSAKLMRGKKSEDVIFAGSDKRGRAGMAEVVATFDNRDHKIPVDAAEVSIGRRITRSGESEYLLNGTKVRLLDIIDLVLKSNIGTSRYTVIGQGTIDQMILAGPSEIKNLIDEASGVKTYYLKRDRTLRRLEQTAQNLMRAEDLLRELEPRVKSLRRQAKRMEAREAIEIDLKAYQKEYLGSQWWQYATGIARLDKELVVLSEQQQQVNAVMDAHLQKIEQHEKDNEQSLAEYKRVQEQLQAKQSEKNVLLEQVSLIRGKMQSQKSGSTDSSSLQVDSHAVTQKIIEVESQLVEATRKQQSASKQAAAAETSLSAINAQLTELYAALSNPAGSDWVEIDEQMQALDKTFVQFERIIEETADINQIRNATSAIVYAWQNFKKSAATAAKHPDYARKLQLQLSELANQKDKLLAEQSALTMTVSKAELSREFLQGQLASLKNEQLQIDLELKKVSASSNDTYVAELVIEEKKVQEQVATISKQLVDLEEKLQAFYSAENSWKTAIAEEDKMFRRQQDELSRIRDQATKLQIEKARMETLRDGIVTEIIASLGSEMFDKIQGSLIKPETEGLESKITKLKNQLALVGGVDELTIQEYHETESRYTNLEHQITDLHKSMEDLRQVMDELDGHIKTKFNTAFHKVNMQFEQYFRILFNGGRAYLSLIKAADAKTETEVELEKEAADDAGEQLRPEEKIVAKYEKDSLAVSGVDIKATPPGKKLSSIQSLSGGERSLTSIALLCSLLTCFPSPFVVLDEVDAALDEANTIRFGQILGKLADTTQFITITHNRETMAQANILYGVTMGDDGVSQLLSIKMDQATAYAK
ncbi:MAG TPA: chromosome segregation SMC family protein [Candidatus Doudnabacteria bacterium]|nr:chromosome segregation SMC family protein [Candidatus Doudnabacteria bacterium]